MDAINIKLSDDRRRNIDIMCAEVMRTKIEAQEARDNLDHERADALFEEVAQGNAIIGSIMVAAYTEQVLSVAPMLQARAMCADAKAEVLKG